MTKTETIITDIYDSWRAQDLDLLASYLPDDFSHMIHIPTEVHPLGGLCRGKMAALDRLGIIAAQFEVSFGVALGVQKLRPDGHSCPFERLIDSAG